jgi:hypothetical protein
MDDVDSLKEMTPKAIDKANSIEGTLLRGECQREERVMQKG